VCCFCKIFETIQHLFFDCVLAKFLWRVIQLTFGLTKPHNITQVYGGWLQNMDAKIKRILFVGIGAMILVNMVNPE
jgi:fructose-specific phosphotransferase system IIC component